MNGAKSSRALGAWADRTSGRGGLLAAALIQEFAINPGSPVAVAISIRSSPSGRTPRA